MKKRKPLHCSVRRALLLILIFLFVSFGGLLHWVGLNRLDVTGVTFQESGPASRKAVSDCPTTPEGYPFHPIEFMEHGVGKDFLPLFHKQLNRPKQRLLKVRFVVYTTGGVCSPIIYYHIHKNGGSTMNVRGDPRVEPYYTPQEQALGREGFHRQAEETLRRAGKLKTSRGWSTIFTFLRDPVTRFLSGVGQSLKLNKLGPCNKENPGDTVRLLECVLSKIQDKESFLDEHLEPQAFELYHGMMGHNLTVNVLDLKSIGNSLKGILGPSSSQSTTRRQRKGLVSGYNLSSALLPSSIIERICTVYRMDVLLIKTVGTEISSMCT